MNRSTNTNMKTKDIKKLKKSICECCAELRKLDVGRSGIAAISMIDPQFKRDVELLKMFLNEGDNNDQQNPQQQGSASSSSKKKSKKLDKIGFDIE